MGKPHTIDEIINSAKQCNTLKEFYTNYNGYYSSAIKLGILDKLNLKTERIYKHSLESTKFLALNCKSKSEFKKKYPGAYKSAIKNKWIDDFNWLNSSSYIEDPLNKIHFVYVYEFKEAIYVGRTNNTTRRDRDHRKEHLHKNKIEKSIVLKYSELVNEPIPKIRILESNLTLQESRKQEDYWVKWYKINTNKLILNKGVTGEFSGSVGSLSKIWTKERILEEAKKYDSIKDFSMNNGSAYNASRKYPNLLNMVFSDKDKRKSLKKSVYKISKDGYIIQRFNSIAEASKATSINKNNIALCAKNLRKTAEGYKWKYENKLIED